jgi:hypothetical protein
VLGPAKTTTAAAAPNKPAKSAKSAKSIEETLDDPVPEFEEGAE